MRSLVGRIRLGAHHDDLAIETRISKARGNCVTRRAAARDQR
jgi:hypothetical protein